MADCALEQVAGHRPAARRNGPPQWPGGNGRAATAAARGRRGVPWLSVSGSGRTLVAWADVKQNERVVTRDGPRRAWTAATSIGRGGFPQATVDAVGDAAVIWQAVSSRPNYTWQIDADFFAASQEPIPSAVSSALQKIRRTLSVPAVGARTVAGGQPER